MRLCSFRSWQRRPFAGRQMSSSMALQGLSVSSRIQDPERAIVICGEGCIYRLSSERLALDGRLLGRSCIRRTSSWMP